MPSWGQWIAAFASTYTVVANVLPFFLVMVLLITGVLIPYCNKLSGIVNDSANHGILEVHDVLYFSRYLSHRRRFICHTQQSPSNLRSCRICYFQSTQWSILWILRCWFPQIISWISRQSWRHIQLPILLPQWGEWRRYPFTSLLIIVPCDIEYLSKW